MKLITYHEAWTVKQILKDQKHKTKNKKRINKKK